MFQTPYIKRFKEEHFEKTSNSSKYIKLAPSKVLSAFSLFGSDGFIYKEYTLFIKTDIYLSWKDEDPVALCGEDGITTKWYKKNASGDGSTEDTPAELLGKIPPGKEMYRLVLMGADAIHYIYRYPVVPPYLDVTNDTDPPIDKDVPPTDFRFIKIPWGYSDFKRNLLANPYQHTGMRRIRKKTDNGSQELPEDEGIFTIDLIA